MWSTEKRSKGRRWLRWWMGMVAVPFIGADGEARGQGASMPAVKWTSMADGFRWGGEAMGQAFWGGEEALGLRW
jgi:hypothetical protein